MVYVDDDLRVFSSFRFAVSENLLLQMQLSSYCEFIKDKHMFSSINFSL